MHITPSPKFSHRLICPCGWNTSVSRRKYKNTKWLEHCRECGLEKPDEWEAAKKLGWSARIMKLRPIVWSDFWKFWNWCDDVYV